MVVFQSGNFATAATGAIFPVVVVVAAVVTSRVPHGTPKSSKVKKYHQHKVLTLQPLARAYNPQYFTKPLAYGDKSKLQPYIGQFSFGQKLWRHRCQTSFVFLLSTQAPTFASKTVSLRFIKERIFAFYEGRIFRLELRGFLN